MVALDVVVVAAVALLGLLVAGLLRSHADILRALHQMGVDLGPDGPATPAATARRPTPGRPASDDVVDLVGATPSGDAVSIPVTSVGHDTVVGFLSSGCSTCRAFWEAFRAGVSGVPGGARLVVVTRGAEAESPQAIRRLGGDHLRTVMSSQAWEHYDVPAAPYFVYISGAQGKVVGEGTASTWSQVLHLIDTAVADGTTSATEGRERRVDADLRAA
ncbi:MAG: TlpA family protein disulfide reductase, partial [Candidatus Dormibacteria bacterium]